MDKIVYQGVAILENSIIAYIKEQLAGDYGAYKTYIEPVDTKADLHRDQEHHIDQKPLD